VLRKKWAMKITKFPTHGKKTFYKSTQINFFAKTKHVYQHDVGLNNHHNRFTSYVITNTANGLMMSTLDYFICIKKGVYIKKLKEPLFKRFSSTGKILYILIRYRFHLFHIPYMLYLEC
jgi:hypothetical protein